LVEHLVKKEAATSYYGRYLVGVSGIPGSGKTTLSAEVFNRLNERWPNVSIVLPMDGFHYSKAELDGMPDPATAHRRRGAAFTFNAPVAHANRIALLRLLKSLRTRDAVEAPSFDHAVGDPVEGDIVVEPSHRIVIIEGLYLSLDDDIWRDIHGIFDETWFISIDMLSAMDRLARRHVQT
ncbi:P-loop containing nucleoside triphosphate hydrolase protein, partial [Gaertneriomyces semiglobifer]